MQHIDDIEWNKLPNGEFTRNEILSDYCKYDITYENMSERLLMVQEKLRKKETFIPFSINEMLDGKKYGSVKLQMFKEVSTL